MPTVLKIELDASKAERDLAQFRAKVEALKTLESQPAEKTISVKVETKGAAAAIARTGKELKAATVPAETFRTRASAAFRNVWKDLSDGEGLVKNLTGALKGVLSPVGAIGLGMAALGKIAVDVWDRMTLSAAEYLERSGRAADVAEKKREKLQAEQAQELRHLAALRELASQETLSNTAKQEAGVLLDQLSAKYGSLGVAIDKTGNRLTGFDKAQEKILSKMRRARIAAGEETYSRLQDKAFAQVQYAVTGMTPGEETLNKFGLSLRGAQSAKRTAAEVMRSQPLEKQLEFARHMMSDESRTQEEMDRWGKAVDVLEQMVERRKELKALERTGFASEEERANAYRENAALDASVRRNSEQAAQTASDREFAAERDPEGKIANREKLIAFLPTWRKDLAGTLSDRAGERKYSESFRESEYFRFYDGLIHSPELLEAMERAGYRGEFHLHPSLRSQLRDFQSNPLITVGDDQMDYSRIFARASLLITDYSSVAFDFAYLRKPVIYTQFDRNDIEGRHIFEKGYFDYEQDGFGPVVYDLQTAIDAIVRFVASDCAEPELYRDRVDTFFRYNDRRNSERVCREIIRMEDSTRPYLR